MSSFTRSESGFMKKKKKLVKSRMDVKRSPNELNKGAWTEEEDRHLAEVIAINGPRKWKTIATTAGLRRCGKSCRLRWLNYLRPNIKRGNMSDQEEDLILRLHKLLGNRWSLIAGRLPGRTDNEIKNYWNSHLSKRKRQSLGLKIQEENNNSMETEHKKETLIITTTTTVSTSDSFNTDDFFDFSNENPIHLEWVSRFLK